MELPIVSALEFDQLRSSIKNYIRTKTDFTDYDFEGSNMSMLVDVLAYNTLYTSYNVNMAANELNLDTAVIRDNVVSIAKRLGYNPNSYTSPKVLTNLTVTGTSNYDIIRIRKGPLLSATASNKNFTFILRDDLEIAVRGRSSVSFTDVEVIEGSDFAITYTVDESNEHQRFFIPNNFVDSDTIRVSVISDPTNNKETEYTRKNTIVDVAGSDEVFFVEEVQDQKYEIIFGDDVIGRKLRNGEIVKIQYVITSGSEANNIRKFNFIGKFSGISGNVEVSLPSSSLTWSLVSDYSDGGSEFESIRSIKYRAPRYYASQERAVTLSDYESIIQQIYSNADLVNVVGGESLTPPRFGKVFITIKPIVGESVSALEKQRIIRELKKYKVGSVDVEVLDPTTIDIIARPIVLFDPSKTRNKDFNIITLITDFINKYITGIEFNSFGGTYSDLEVKCGIKDLDNAIKYVNVPIYLRQLIRLVDKVETDYNVDFYTKLKIDSESEYYMISDPFCHTGISTPVFLGAKSNCNQDYSVNLYTVTGRFIKTVGKIDIETGNVSFTVQSCQSTPINITVIPEILDITFGPNIVPKMILLQPEVVDTIDDLNDRSQLLDDDQSTLPVDDILSLPADGDTTVIVEDDILSLPADGDTTVIVDPTSPPPLTVLPGGSVVTVPTIDTGLPTDGGTGPIISDENNISTIDDFTPETNPYSCS